MFYWLAQTILHSGSGNVNPFSISFLLYLDLTPSKKKTVPSGNTMQVFAGHTGPVNCGEFTPDGKYLFPSIYC